MNYPDNINFDALDRFYEDDDEGDEDERRVMIEKTKIIKGYELYRTCNACPEQYDVMKDGKQVGYLRLRYGYFSAEYPDCGGTEVYEAKPMGYGMFFDNEREFYLNAAVDAIEKEHNRAALEDMRKLVFSQSKSQL